MAEDELGGGSQSMVASSTHESNLAVINRVPCDFLETQVTSGHDRIQEETSHASDEEVFSDYEKLQAAVGDGEQTSSDRAADQERDFAEFVQSADAFERAKEDVEPCLYSMLDRAYSFRLRHLTDNAAVKKFCEDHIAEKCTAATLKNPFIPILKSVSKEKVNQVTIDRARALLYAFTSSVALGGIPDFLRANGGVRGCKESMVKPKLPKIEESASGVESVKIQKRVKKTSDFFMLMPIVDDGNYKVEVKIRGGKPIFVGYLTPESALV